MTARYLAPSASLALTRLGYLTVNTTQGGLALLLVALVLTSVLAIGQNFLAFSNVQSMAFQLPELGILSLGMMIVLLQGGVNLSLISTANIAAITAASILATTVPSSTGVAWYAWQVVALGAALGVGAVVGAVNGYMIGYMRVSPILTTLGTMIAVKGTSIGVTHGTVISGFPAPVIFLGSGALYGVPFSLILFGVLAAVFAVVLNAMPFGSIVILIGSNEAATAYSGVDTRWALFRAYMISSLLAAVGGLVMMARFNSANASYGETYLLITILAAVLGGVDPYGGFGKVSGLLLSLLILQVISSAFNQLGFSQFLTLAIWGLTLIAVNAISNLRGHGPRR